jgi:hypothetical protein
MPLPTNGNANDTLADTDVDIGSDADSDADTDADADADAADAVRLPMPLPIPIPLLGVRTGHPMSAGASQHRTSMCVSILTCDLRGCAQAFKLLGKNIPCRHAHGALAHSRFHSRRGKRALATVVRSRAINKHQPLGS